MNDDSLRLTPKSLHVLKLIAAGHSYAQVVDSDADLNYHDMFSAAKEAVSIDNLLAKLEAESMHNEIRPPEPSAMERAKLTYRGAYKPWTKSLDANEREQQRTWNPSRGTVKSMDRSGAEAAVWTNPVMKLPCRRHIKSDVV